LSPIRDERFERFVYRAIVFKSLMFAAGGHHPDRSEPGGCRERSLMLFVKQSVIRASPERVFAFHERPDALRLLIPPWEPTRVLDAAPDLCVGAEAVVETRLLWLVPVRWLARHTLYDPPRVFEDVQIEGPFKSWRHRHVVEPHEKGAVLRDEVDFETPFGVVGRLAAPLLVEPRLRRLFDYRHRVTREWCERTAQD
jgi:ligand-binding SRPBCC domain-containing protein